MSFTLIVSYIIIRFAQTGVYILPEPVGVGFSYSDDGSVKDSQVAAEDVYAFLMLFISQACLHLSYSPNEAS
jgi:hypothetical protein